MDIIAGRGRYVGEVDAGSYDKKPDFPDRQKSAKPDFTTDLNY